MVIPDKITKYNRTLPALEEFIIFCVFVAGHNAHSTASALDSFLKKLGPGSPFKALRDKFALGNQMRQVISLLKASGIGCYTRNAKFLNEIVHSDINLRTCTVEELERFTGIGPKTSRFFVLHSRKRATNIAVLDTHSLKYLGSKGYDVPKSTPTGKRYAKLEKDFVAEAKRAKMTVADFDLAIWKRYRIAPKEK